MEYRLLWEEPTTKVYIEQFNHYCWFRYPCPFYGYKQKSGVYVYQNNVMQGYYSTEDMKNSSKGAFKFYSNPKNMKKVIEAIVKVGEQNREYLNKVNSVDLFRATNQELLSLLKLDHETFLESLGAHYLSMPWIFNDIEKYIKTELKELGVKNVPKVFLDLTAITRPSIIEKSNLKLLEKIQKEQNDLLKKLNLSDQSLNFLNAIRELGWYRINHTRIYWTNCREMEFKIFDAISKRLPISSVQVSMCLPDEVFQILKENKVSKEIMGEIGQRTKFFLMKTNFRKREIYSGEKAKDEFKRIIGMQDYKAMTQVKGIPANIGKINGKARVFKNEIFDLKKCSKEMQKGEILICQNTWPELYPIFSKASAIITNEGGVCSHGSVIAREFNIPGIVGTIIATKVFKTGDKVEVDGEKGIICKVT